VRPVEVSKAAGVILVGVWMANDPLKASRWAVDPLGATGCNEHRTVDLKRAAPTKHAYTRRDVQRAFALEESPLSVLPTPRYGGVIWLTAKDWKLLGEVSIAVYPAKDATRPLGLRIQLSTHDRLVRVRNVTISYASTSPFAAKVEAALTRLRRMKPATH
jgi:hypothetical protein